MKGDKCWSSISTLLPWRCARRGSDGALRNGCTGKHPNSMKPSAAASPRSQHSTYSPPRAAAPARNLEGGPLPPSSDRLSASEASCVRRLGPKTQRMGSRRVMDGRTVNSERTFNVRHAGTYNNVVKICITRVQ